MVDCTPGGAICIQNPSGVKRISLGTSIRRADLSGRANWYTTHSRDICKDFEYFSPTVDRSKLSHLRQTLTNVKDLTQDSVADTGSVESIIPRHHFFIFYSEYNIRYSSLTINGTVGHSFAVVSIITIPFLIIATTCIVVLSWD